MPVLDFGGVESRIVTQSALMDRERFDYRVCAFWTLGAAARALEAQGVTVVNLGIDPAPRNPRALARLAQYVFDNKVDVVHASILEANFHAALLRSLPFAPSVAIEEVGNPTRSLVARAVLGAVYRQADVVIGVSKKTCDVLRNQHWVPKRKVRLIYNSVNPRFFTPPRTASSQSPLKFLMVGRIVEVKNQESVIRAIASLNEDLRPTLEIVGEGPLRPKLEALVQDLRVAEQVRFLGFREDIVQLLDECDVYVISSFSEGTSISLAEAMARARPVIASRADGVDEAMEGYPPGWQVEPTDISGWADAIRRLAEMPALQRDELGRGARATVERLMSPARWRSDLEALYVELAQRAVARRARPLTTAARAIAGWARRSPRS
jgi:glycosyltransferase involved in cell wall biosynthesis